MPRGEFAANVNGSEVRIVAKTGRGGRMALKASGGGFFVLEMPAGTSVTQVSKFIDGCGEFIRRHGGKKPVADLSVTSSLWSDVETGNAVLGILGSMLTLAPSPKAVKTEIEDGRLKYAKAADESARTATMRALRELTEHAAGKMCARYAVELGTAQPSKVFSRQWDGRWGECSRDRAIGIDWRCLFLPGELFFHICAHETCHLLEMNHGPAFKRLLRGLRPRASSESRELSDWKVLMPKL